MSNRGRRSALRCATTHRRSPIRIKPAGPAGFMVDLCRAVMKHLADDLNLGEIKIVYVPVTAADRFDAIRRGNADLLCEPTSETLSAAQPGQLLHPTFVDGASLMVRGDGPTNFEALAGKKWRPSRHDGPEQGLRATLDAANVKADVVRPVAPRKGSRCSTPATLRLISPTMRSSTI